MKKSSLFLSLISAPPVVYASEDKSQYLLGSLFLILIFLLFFIIAQKFRLRSGDQDLLALLATEQSDELHESKTALIFDLQEVFLYFFKTLAHEASSNNNTFLLRQKMLVPPAADKSKRKSTLADRIKPRFLPDLLPSKPAKDNLSESIDAHRQLVRPPRRFFGDYTEAIDAIYAACELLSSCCANKLIAIDLEQLAGPDKQVLFSIEVSICEPHNDEIAAIFAELMAPTQPETAEKLERFERKMRRCTSVKYFIKDTQSRQNCCIAVSFPIMLASSEQPCEIAPAVPLKALIVHESTDVARSVVANLNEFNIECVYNRSAQGLGDCVSDAVNFPYRAVFIDAELFARQPGAEQARMLSATAYNHFELVLILGNSKACSLLSAATLERAIFLPLPYTVDNVRAIVSAIVAQHERLLG